VFADTAFSLSVHSLYRGFEIENVADDHATRAVTFKCTNTGEIEFSLLLV